MKNIFEGQDLFELCMSFSLISFVVFMFIAIIFAIVTHDDRMEIRMKMVESCNNVSVEILHDDY